MSRNVYENDQKGIIVTTYCGKAGEGRGIQISLTGEAAGWGFTQITAQEFGDIVKNVCNDGVIFDEVTCTKDELGFTELPAKYVTPMAMAHKLWDVCQ